MIIDPRRMQAFTCRQLETGITVHLHLKALGYTFEDLREYVETMQQFPSSTEIEQDTLHTLPTPPTPTPRKFVNEVNKLTRAQRRAQKHGSRRKV